MCVLIVGPDDVFFFLDQCMCDFRSVMSTLGTMVPVSFTKRLVRVRVCVYMCVFGWVSDHFIHPHWFPLLVTQPTYISQTPRP